MMRDDPKYMRELHQGIYDGIMRGDGYAAADAIPQDYYIERNHLL